MVWPMVIVVLLLGVGFLSLLIWMICEMVDAVEQCEKNLEATYRILNRE